MTDKNAPRLTDHQLGILFRPVHHGRVGQVRGMAHMEAWDIRRELIRVFGFGGWDLETLSLDLVTERETKNGDRSRWTIVYRAQVRLTVKDTAGQVIARYEDGAAGDAINQPSIGDAHDQAMKTALSQALKRCAVNLGDQFGMSLYNNGSTDAVVGWSAAHPPAATARAAAPEPPEDPPVQPEPRPASAPADEQAEPPVEAAPTPTAVPAEEPPTAGPDDTPAQRIANLAAQQPTEWRRYWKAGTHARVMEHEITAPDVKGREQLGVYLTRLGKSVTDSAAAERAVVLAAGQRHGLDETALAQEFATSYGHPMAEAAPAELRQFAGLMNGAAA